VTRGFFRTSEASALVTRTGRHFAHKVPVRTDGETTTIETRFGAAVLRAVEDGISVQLEPVTPEAEADLRSVIATHAERFARGPLEITWS
jgi:hypothetical protein